MQTIDEVTRTTHLGEHLPRKELLSERGMDKALRALTDYQQRLTAYPITAFRCVATEACRRGKNAVFFKERIQKSLGLTLEIITPQEEAFLIAQGFTDLMDQNIPYGLIFDIGGGSTEIIWGRCEAGDFTLIDSLSLPYGLLLLSDLSCTQEEKEKAAAAIRTQVQHFAHRHQIDRHIKNDAVQMMGSSGLIAMIAALHIGLETYDRQQVHGVQLTQDEIQSLFQYLLDLTPQERALHPCLGPHRATLAEGGICIFQSIYDILNVPTVLTADRGVCDGITRTLAQQHQQLQNFQAE